MMRPIFALSLFCMLIGCGQPDDVRVPPASKDALRFLDINVWSGLDYKGSLWMGEYESSEIREKRYQILLQEIIKLDPDVIAVHEANKLPDYAERLARDIGFDYFYHVGVGGVRLGKVGLPWNLREGDAIFTRPDLHAEFAGRKQLSGGHVGNFLTFHFDDATQILAVRFKNKEQEMCVFATHWHASPLDSDSTQWMLDNLNNDPETNRIRQRWRQEVNDGAVWRQTESDSTLAFITRIAGDKPFVLMGDFNATHDLIEIKNLMKNGLLDSYALANPQEPGFTWFPAENRNFSHYLAEQARSKNNDPLTKLHHIHQRQPKRIDFIFVGPQRSLHSLRISVSSSRVVLNDPVDGMHASDHFGVLTLLKWL